MWLGTFQDRTYCVALAPWELSGYVGLSRAILFNWPLGSLCDYTRFEKIPRIFIVCGHRSERRLKDLVVSGDGGVLCVVCVWWLGVWGGWVGYRLRVLGFFACKITCMSNSKARSAKMLFG